MHTYYWYQISGIKKNFFCERPQVVPRCPQVSPDILMAPAAVTCFITLMTISGYLRLSTLEDYQVLTILAHNLCVTVQPNFR